MKCVGGTQTCHPMPFAMRDVPAAPEGYSVVLDARVTGTRMQMLLGQMMHGGFMDNVTRGATAQVLAWNPKEPLSLEPRGTLKI
eukprot:4502375-Pyramimonas_sp.AAC.1